MHTDKYLEYRKIMNKINSVNFVLSGKENQDKVNKELETFLHNLKE